MVKSALSKKSLILFNQCLLCFRRNFNSNAFLNPVYLLRPRQRNMTTFQLCQISFHNMYFYPETIQHFKLRISPIFLQVIVTNQQDFGQKLRLSFLWRKKKLFCASRFYSLGMEVCSFIREMTNYNYSY